MQLSCITRTILTDVLHCSIFVICCDLELHMLHHSFQRLYSRANPVADSPLVDSIPSGGPDFITDWEPMCKQQKSPHIALTHGVCLPRWDRRLKETHVKVDIWLLRDYVCLRDACERFNFSLSAIQGSQLKWRPLAFWAFSKIWNSCKSATAHCCSSNRGCN